MSFDYGRLRKKQPRRRIVFIINRLYHIWPQCATAFCIFRIFPDFADGCAKGFPPVKGKQKDAARRPWQIPTVLYIGRTGACFAVTDQRQAIAAIVTAAAARMEVTTMSVMACSPFFKVGFISFLFRGDECDHNCGDRSDERGNDELHFFLSFLFRFTGLLCPPSTPVQYHSRREKCLDCQI
ncbi:MAG: hypothetical protein IKW76_12900 [Clostridia bacterium]|nr:hypothetical protein [Clostridia bacterium]